MLRRLEYFIIHMAQNILIIKTKIILKHITEERRKKIFYSTVEALVYPQCLPVNCNRSRPSKAANAH